MHTEDSIHLIGIALPQKTTNENGQSSIDCGTLWQRFEKESIHSQIPAKLNNEVYAVYHDYEGDYMKPFSYFIGCKTEPGVQVPEGLLSLTIPTGAYQKFLAKGKMPMCIAEAWQAIWAADIRRAYTFDFEIYGERSYNWDDAEVDIFVSTI